MAIGLYETYELVFRKTPDTGRAMPYHWTNLPNPLNGRWMPYSIMLDEFSTELANNINAFSHYVHSLQAWAIVVQPLSDEKKLEATYEFIDVLATIAVNLPSVIKSRFEFATAHLCHQANFTRDSNRWKDDLPLDHKIVDTTTDKYSHSWSTYAPLKSILKARNAPAFKNTTGDFRNAYNHRFSPRFVIGMTKMVSRYPGDKIDEFIYSFSEHQALDLSEISNLLVAERDRFYLAFAAFQALVGEHEAAIRDASPRDVG